MDGGERKEDFLMVHWTFYPVMGTLIAGFLVFSYYYLRWARDMDRLNEDHWEYLKDPIRDAFTG